MSFSIALCIKNKPLADGLYPIYIRLTLFGETKYQSTGVSCEKKHWNPKKGRISPNSPRAFANKYLQKKEEDILKVVLKDNNITKSHAAIFDLLVPKTASLYKYAVKFLAQKTEDGEHETVHYYEQIIKQTKAFKPEIKISDVDKKWIKDYINYLKPTCNNNSIITKVTFWANVFKQVIEDEMATRNPFKAHGLKANKTKIKIIPSQADIKALITVYDNLKGKQKVAVGVYLTQYFTRGTRISDITLLQKVNVFENFILIKEKKTSEYKRFGIHPIVRHIINQYNEPHYVFPLCEWYNNDSLSEKQNALARKKALAKARAQFRFHFSKACKAAGITKHLTSHSSRHGFATNLIKSVNGNIREVQRALNHKTSKTTEVYMHDIERSDFSDLEDKVYAQFNEITKKLVG